MSFNPYPNRSGFIALGVAIVSGAVVVVLVNSLLQQTTPPEIFKQLLGVLIGLGLTTAALYWTLVAFKLGYHLNRNGLAIRWGLSQQLIPFNAIEAVIPGKDVSTSPNFREINIAGLRFGWGKLAEYGPLKFRTTARLVDSLLIVTASQAYIISPRHPDNFLKAWQARQGLGFTQEWTAGMRRSWPLNIPLLADPLTWWLLGAAALICLSLFGYLSLRYPELSPSLPIHFDNFGRADRIVDKLTLFTLPVTGVTVWVINAFLGSLIYRREKVAAYLLWGSTVFMQMCLWVAVLTITL